MELCGGDENVIANETRIVETTKVGGKKTSKAQCTKWKEKHSDSVHYSCGNKHLSFSLIAKGKYSLCPFPMFLVPSKM